MRTPLAITLMLVCSSSWACSCGAVSIAEEYTNSAAVLKGVVISSEESIEPDSTRFFRTRLDVQTVWKSNGLNPDTIFVLGEILSCGTRLVPGVEYIVFAYKSPTRDRLETDGCARNTPTTLPANCGDSHSGCDEYRKFIDELTEFLNQKPH